MSMLVCVFIFYGETEWVGGADGFTQGFKMPSKFLATFIQYTYCTSMYIINV